MSFIEYNLERLSNVLDGVNRPSDSSSAQRRLYEEEVKSPSLAMEMLDEITTGDELIAES
jgi:hypothetical protein